MKKEDDLNSNIHSGGLYNYMLFALSYGSLNSPTSSFVDQVGLLISIDHLHSNEYVHKAHEQAAIWRAELNAGAFV